MGRSPCCIKEGLNRGAWTAQEDQILRDYIKVNGEGRWRNLPKKAGLKRCGKSCRLRWLNYLRPDIKRGNISPDEEELIIRLHKLLGNRWSLIAGRLPGRTDNEIKNYWNTNLSKKVDDRQNPSLSHRQISRQSSEKNSTRPGTKTSNDTTSQSPSSLVIMENKIFKTKAIKCTTNVCDSSAWTQNSDPLIDSGSVRGSKTESHPLFDTQAPLASHQPNEISTPANGEFFNSDDFIIDFNIGDLCISDLLNSDLSSIEGLNYSNTTTGTGELSPSSGHPAIFCGEKSQGWTPGEWVEEVNNVRSDLQSLASWFDYNGANDE